MSLVDTLGASCVHLVSRAAKWLCSQLKGFLVLERNEKGAVLEDVQTVLRLVQRVVTVEDRI